MDDDNSKEAIFSKQLGVGVDFDRRTIYLFGEINADAAYRSIAAIEKLDSINGDIRIVLNSEGGSESDGWAIYDSITMCKNRVVIEGYGLIYSIAAAIFQAGDVRKMSSNASILIHDGDWELGETKQNVIVETAKRIEQNNKIYYTILSNASKLSYEKIAELCKHDTYFSAIEALRNGLVDEIMPPLKKRAKKGKKKS